MNTTQNVKQFKDHEAMAPAPKVPKFLNSEDWEKIPALNQCLAHSLELSCRIKQAHWGAKGENFYIFHKMSDDFTKQLQKQSDNLSARIVALGGTPTWTPEKIVEASVLSSYPTDLMKVEDHIEALKSSYEQAAQQLPPLISKLTRSDDFVTANVIANFTKVVDEQKAFIAAHSGLAWLEKPKRQYA
jgi:starvation-inducible DNA-binding protein